MKSGPKLDEIAHAIREHLQKAEADHEWNRRVWTGKDGRKHETSKLYSAGARATGRFVSVTYISYQGCSSLTKAEALAYLDWLDRGHRGTHYTQQQKQLLAQQHNKGETDA